MTIADGEDDARWTSTPPRRYCRDRAGYFVAESDFRFRTCASCYAYLFPDPPHLVTDGPYLVQRNAAGENYDSFTDSFTVTARWLDVETNSTVSGLRENYDATDDVIMADVNSDLWRTAICDTLKDGDGCGRWIDCCRSAEQCCRDQLEMQSRQTTERVQSGQYGQLGQSPTCPITWDGYSCWPETDPGVTASNSCPTFLPFASQSGNEDLMYS